MAFDFHVPGEVVVDEEPHMPFGLGVNHAVLEHDVRQAHVVDSEATAGSSMIVSMLEFDQILQQ